MDKLKVFWKEFNTFDGWMNVLYIGNLVFMLWLIHEQGKVMDGQSALLKKQSNIISKHGMGEILSVTFRLDGEPYFIYGNAYYGVCEVYSPIEGKSSCLLKWETTDGK